MCIMSAFKSQNNTNTIQSNTCFLDSTMPPMVHCSFLLFVRLLLTVWLSNVWRCWEFWGGFCEPENSGGSRWKAIFWGWQKNGIWINVYKVSPLFSIPITIPIIAFLPPSPPLHKYEENENIHFFYATRTRFEIWTTQTLQRGHTQ